MKTIIIFTDDPIVETDPFRRVWLQVGNRVWESFDAVLGDKTRNEYIESRIPGSENYYFEIVGLEYFKQFGIPYH